MDAAHDWTDERIAKMQARFREVYEQAAREMARKLADGMEDYQAENAKWREMVASGDATQRQYDAWKADKAMEQQWQTSMVDALTEDAVNADRLCMDAINDELPRIYAENANYGAYDVASKLGHDVTFTLYDQSTVRRMLMADPQLYPEASMDLPKDRRWNRQKLNSAMTQGILQGESIPNMAKRLMGVLAMDERTAMRVARTASTSAENAGRIDSYRRAERMGIGLRQQWMATLDLRTRHTHRLLDGQRVAVGGWFEPKGYGPRYRVKFPADPQGLPEMVLNCFIGETLVTTDSPIEASYCHEYSGELVTIDTANGIHFTCTPNHPILTPAGWIAAASLNNGDDLLVTGRRNFKRTLWNPDVNHAFASMKAVHDLFEVLFTKRATVTGVDFHGDVATSDVEVIAKKGLLRFGFNPSVFECVNKLTLKTPDALDLCEGATVKGLRRIVVATSRIMSSLRICASLLWGHGSHTDVHGLRAATRCDSRVTEYAINNLPAETMVRSKLLSRLPGQVFIDKVASIEVSSTRGAHVYNLQTGSGYYFANEQDNGKFIIAKNCRCTLVAAVDGVDLGDMERWSRLPEGMTYEQWKGEKEAEQAPTIGGVRRGEPMTFERANELRGNPKYALDGDAKRAWQVKERAKSEALNRFLQTHSQEDRAAYDLARLEAEEALQAYRDAQRQAHPYKVNCQTCVVANEARRRGYDVEATGNTRGSVNAQVARNTALAWIDPRTGEHPRYVTYDGQGTADSLGEPIPTPTRFWDWLDGTVRDGRYVMELEWRGRSHTGHIVCLERTGEGLRLYDPQNGEVKVGDGVREYLRQAKYRTTTGGFTFSAAPRLLKVSEMDFDTDVVNQILRPREA